MKKSRFTETQLFSIVKQADAGMPVKDFYRHAGLSVPTNCRQANQNACIEHFNRTFSEDA